MSRRQLTQLECLQSLVRQCEETVRLHPSRPGPKANLRVMQEERDREQAWVNGERPEPSIPRREKGTPAKDLQGYGACALLRWLGRNGKTVEQGEQVMKGLGLPVALATIKIQVKAGSKGERGEPAPLTREQVAQILALCD